MEAKELAEVGLKKSLNHSIGKEDILQRCIEAIPPISFCPEHLLSSSGKFPTI